jgi:hypothetical protein
MSVMTRVVSLLLGAALVVAGTMTARAQDPEKTFATDNFRITYIDNARSPAAPDLADDDGSGVPDAIERLARAFEDARSFLLDDLGYLPPPVEGRYRIYIALGGIRTVRAPGGTGRSRASFIVMNPASVRTSTPDERMRALAVHEYFHAVQLGYDGDERDWIMEASSTWIEDEFVDGADPNHGALLSFLPFPRVGLEASGGGHEYGAFAFLQFLVERYGTAPDPRAIVRELWGEMSVPESAAAGGDRDPLGAITAVLERRGTSLPVAWREFTMWERQLRRFEEGASYRRVVGPSEWPSFIDRLDVGAESCRRTTDLSRFDVLPPLSADYARIAPAPDAPDDASALLSVEGPSGATAFALVKRRGAPAESIDLTFSTEGLAVTQVPFGPNEVKSIVIGLGNASSGPATLFYSLRLLGADQTSLTGPAGPFTTIYGTAVPFSGFVSCAGIGQRSAQLEITERENVTGATRTFIVRSADAGGWNTLFTPLVNSTYSARLVDPLLGPGEAADWDVAVQVVTTIAVAADRVHLGDPVHVSGALDPPHPNARIAIEFRRPDGSWEPATEVQPDAQGSFAADITLPRDGIWFIRARMTTTGDSDHEPGTSTERVVEVLPP